MAKDYPYIRAWGNRMGSNRQYVEDEVQRAREAGAPATAIYERYAGSGPTGVWETAETIGAAAVRDAVHARAQAIAGGTLPDLVVPASPPPPD